MSRALRFAPLAVGLLLLSVLVWRLAIPRDDKIHSRLVGQPVPSFALPPAAPGKPPLRSADLAGGQAKLLNIFASWCVPCIAEAPILAQLHGAGVPIDGIAIRDRPEDVAAFLEQHGDPFGRIGGDIGSKVQIALGSSGVPESFIVDGAGIIRYHHIGPIAAADIPMILGEVEKAR